MHPFVSDIGTNYFKTELKVGAALGKAAIYAR